MLEKFREQRTIKKSEKEKIQLEKQAEEAKRKEEMLAAEKARFEEEKQRLLNLSDKELQVEMIFAIRGFYNKVSELEEIQADLVEQIEILERSISEIDMRISTLESNARYSD